MSCSVSGLLSWTPLSATKDKTGDILHVEYRSNFATWTWCGGRNAAVNRLERDKMHRDGRLKQLTVPLPRDRGIIGVSVVGLRAHYGPACFSADWPVWETLGYNLLVLTCSLKKALSTGIRLSWQGQLSLALPISHNVSIKLLSVFWFPYCHLSSVN